MKLVGILIVTAVLAFGPAAASNAQGSYTPSQPTTSPAPPAASPPAGEATKRDVRPELKTAITHVGEAAKADSQNTVRLHLGHVVNCIEGANGKNFNASWGNPCDGQGNGILADLKTARGGAAMLPTAQRAESAAMAGMKAKKLADAKKAAKEAMDLLKQVSSKLE